MATKKDHSSEEEGFVGEEKNVDVRTEAAITVTGNGLADLLSQSAANVLKASKLLNKAMDLPRVKDDPNAVQTMFKLVTDYNIELIDTVAKVMAASKTKDGKLPGVTEAVLKGVDAAMGAAVGSPESTHNSRIGRLVGGA